MAKITIHGFIQATVSVDGSTHFAFMQSPDLSAYGYTLVTPHDITFEVPDDADYAPKQLAALERARAAALAEVARTESEIAQLGAIGKAE